MRLAENIVKTVTGDDIVTARKQYSGSKDFKPKFKLWLASNHEPKIIGQDDGIWSRLRYIEFAVSFLGREDKGLEKRLLRELRGIMAWALEGLRQWHRNKMGGGTCRRRTSCAVAPRSSARTDQINTFFDAHVAVGGRIGKAAFYKLYKEWALNGGEYVLAEKEFNAAVSQRGIEDDRLNKGMVWLGIHDRFNVSAEREAEKERRNADKPDDDGQSDLSF